jgi:hypothetical protein
MNGYSFHDEQLFEWGMQGGGCKPHSRPSNGNPPNATASRPSNIVDDIEQCTYISYIIMS